MTCVLHLSMRWEHLSSYFRSNFPHKVSVLYNLVHYSGVQDNQCVHGMLWSGSYFQSSISILYTNCLLFGKLAVRAHPCHGQLQYFNLLPPHTHTHTQHPHRPLFPVPVKSLLVRQHNSTVPPVSVTSLLYAGGVLVDSLCPLLPFKLAITSCSSTHNLQTQGPTLAL